MSYTNIFGGTPIQPSDVSYREITLTENITLVWPSSFVDTTEVVAKLMDVISNGDIFDINMPSAMQVSVGESVIYKNMGVQAFTVYDAGGGEIIQIDPGEAFYIYVKDNTTDAGIWGVTQYGTGASTADAYTLEGFGLTTLAATLNTEFSVVEKDDDYTVSALDRATLFKFVGGQAAFTLPSPAGAGIGNGFFFSIHNISAAGQLTIIPTGVGVLIDGFANFIMRPTESSFFVTDGVNWFSLGYGKSTLFTVGILNKVVIGPGPVVLTTAEANLLVHQFSGNLTGNVQITYPNVNAQYYVKNETIGGFSLILTIAGSANPITLIPDASLILYSDGTDLHSIPTEAPGSVAFADGTAAQPSIRFVSDQTTGIYLDSLGNLGISASGNPTVIIDGNDLASFVPINSFNGGYLDYGRNLYSLIRAYDNG
jgi:hypothetical protein